ncbi:hypothetical protein Droror1_Dr00020087 [Drosera rotundifolia]
MHKPVEKLLEIDGRDHDNLLNPSSDCFDEGEEENQKQNQIDRFFFGRGREEERRRGRGRGGRRQWLNPMAAGCARRGKEREFRLRERRYGIEVQEIERAKWKMLKINVRFSPQLSLSVHSTSSTTFTGNLNRTHPSPSPSPSTTATTTTSTPVPILRRPMVRTRNIGDSTSVPIPFIIVVIQSLHRGRGRVAMVEVQGVRVGEGRRLGFLGRRSPAIVIAYLMKSKGWRLSQSYQWVKECRPSMQYIVSLLHHV